MIAKYWAAVGVNDRTVYDGEWRPVPAGDNGCSCVPPPTLPGGTVLAAEVELALSAPVPADLARAARTIPVG